jgi:tetratricopeptide (TPR) repeat protein
MKTQDEKLESILADPWLARPGPRWSLSIIFVLAILFALKPLIINHILVRAEAYASYGLYNNAARECKKVIFLDPNNIRAWNILGDSYKCQEDLDNAVYTYLNALNIDSSNRIAHFRVAMIFALEKKYNQAIPHFERVRSAGPEPIEVLATDNFSCYRSSLEMLSLCYEKTARFSRQQGVLEELARTYPDYARAAEKLQYLKQRTLPQTNP